MGIATERDYQRQVSSVRGCEVRLFNLEIQRGAVIAKTSGCGRHECRARLPLPHDPGRIPDPEMISRGFASGLEMEGNYVRQRSCKSYRTRPPASHKG